MKTINPPTFTEYPHFTPEEYAAMWGGDPCAMREPNLPNDGYLFYNFGSENQERTPEFLNDFIGAIERTIQMVDTNANFNQFDHDDLTALLEYVKELAA